MPDDKVDCQASASDTPARPALDNPYVEAVRDKDIFGRRQVEGVERRHFSKLTKMGDEDMDYLRKVFTKFDDSPEGPSSCQVFGFRGPQ